MACMLEKNFIFWVLRLGKIPKDQTVTWGGKVIFGERGKSNHIYWTTMPRELSYYSWTELIFVCQNSVASVWGKLSNVKDAHLLIIWSCGNIVLIKLAPVYSIYVIEMSLESLRHWFIWICSDIPKENITIYPYGYQFTGGRIIFESEVLYVPQVST